MTEAMRHCEMTAGEGEGGGVQATVIWLDWLQPDGTPNTTTYPDRYRAFDALGEDGWQLVQVTERPGFDGHDGPIAPNTVYYFRRIASKG